MPSLDHRRPRRFSGCVVGKGALSCRKDGQKALCSGQWMGRTGSQEKDLPWKGCRWRLDTGKGCGAQGLCDKRTEAKHSQQSAQRQVGGVQRQE